MSTNLLYEYVYPKRNGSLINNMTEKQVYLAIINKSVQPKLPMQ